MELNLRPWPTLGTVAFRESGENKPLFLVLRVRQRKGEKRLIKTLLVLFPEILKGIGNYHVDLYRKVGGQIGLNIGSGTSQQEQNPAQRPLQNT